MKCNWVPTKQRTKWSKSKRIHREQDWVSSQGGHTRPSTILRTFDAVCVPMQAEWIPETQIVLTNSPHSFIKQIVCARLKRRSSDAALWTQSQYNYKRICINFIHVSWAHTNSRISSFVLLWLSSYFQHYLCLFYFHFSQIIYIIDLAIERFWFRNVCRSTLIIFDANIPNDVLQLCVENTTLLFY